jgi:hypothetical protein
MIQEVLSTKEWFNKLKQEDFRALTLLIYEHVNPYCDFMLDMNKRLKLGCMMKKIILFFIIFTMFLQVNSYSIEKISYLAPSSSLSKAKLIIENDTYSFLKFDDKRYIYIDRAGNTIELFKDEQKWQAKINEKEYKFYTSFFNRFGMKSTIEIEEQKGYLNTLGWLFKNGYQLKIKEKVICLQAPVLLGGMGFGEVKKAKREKNVTELCRILMDEKKETIPVRKNAIEGLVFISKDVELQDLIKILDVLNKAVNFDNNTLKQAATKALSTLKENVKKIKASETQKLNSLQQTFQLTQLEELKPKIIEIQEIIKKLEVFMIGSPVSDEEIILKELEGILGEFKEESKEINEFKEKSIKIKSAILNLEIRDPLAISGLISRLVPDIIDMICSSNPDIHKLGHQLKLKIDGFVAQGGNFEKICRRMLVEFDKNPLLLQKCLVDEFVIFPFQKQQNLDDYNLITECEIEEIEYTPDQIARLVRQGTHKNNYERITWTIKLQNKISKEIEEITIVFNKKDIGFQLGTEMEIKNKMGVKKYFVKTHQQFHLTKSRTGEITETSLKINPPLLEEMLVYKMLDKLGLGAKRYFMVNPYVRSGLYIISEELVSFEEASILEHLEEEKQDTSFKDMLSSEISDSKVTIFKIQINQFDLLGRIFSLRDFNSGNFGIVNRLSNPEWKFLDFEIELMQRDVSLDSFLKGNDVFKYKEGGILSTVLKNREKIEKIQVGIDALKDLKKVRQFNKYLEETVDEILNYLETIIPEEGRTRAESLGMNLEEEKQKLLKYKAYIGNNLRIIYEGLATEHATIMLREILRDNDEFELDISRTFGEKRRRLSANKKEKIFTISENLIVSAGRILNVFGLDEGKSILNYVIEKRIEDKVLSLFDDTRMLVEVMKKLDVIQLVDEREKTLGLLSILELFRLDNLLNLITNIKQSKLKLESFDFNSLKNILMAV